MQIDAAATMIKIMLRVVGAKEPKSHNKHTTQGEQKLRVGKINKYTYHNSCRHSIPF